MEKEKKKRGGERKGAGRPLKYGEPTIFIGFRSPLSEAENVRKVVKNYLKKFKNGINN